MEFTPHNATAVALLFLATTLVVLAGAATALYLAYRGRFRPSRRVAEGLLVVLLVYAGALLAHSFTSQDRVLEPGQLKYFCEIDCHLAYSVESVRTAEVLGEAPAVRAKGRFVVITVKTWFDPNTISPTRGEAELRPNPRTIEMEDSAGGRHAPSLAGLQALAPQRDPRAPLSRPLRPGESYTTDLVFDLPESARGVRLLISEDLPVAPFIVSHENSLFHKKIWFRLPAPNTTSSAPPCFVAGGRVGCYTPGPWRF